MRSIKIIILGAACALTACTPDNGDDILNGSSEAEILATAQQFGALPMEAEDPNGGRMSRDREELGRLLFYDPILSGENDVSCATCHHPDFGYSDGRDLPSGSGARGLGPSRTEGYELVGRNSPTVINTAFNGINANGQYNPEEAPMFWDNRARSLEEQAKGPPQSFSEMRGHAYAAEVTLDSLEERLRNNAEYRSLFRRAFGPGNNVITADNMARAIASFERTIVANNAPFDRFVRGEDNAMNSQEKRGLMSFVAAGCQTCHSGPMFSDYLPHAVGVPEHPDRLEADGGVQGTFAFRTPTLRNLDFTGPYFHNGIVSDLAGVMGLYLQAQADAQAGQGSTTNPNVRELDPLLARQTLQADQVDDIIAFMGALNDENFDRRIPDRVPSGLPVGGTIF